MAALGGFRQRHAIGVVRYSDGHLLRDQVSARLLGVFRVGNSGIACALADQEIWYKLMNLTPKLAPVRQCDVLWEGKCLASSELPPPDRFC